jgi:hypothetical protein
MPNRPYEPVGSSQMKFSFIRDDFISGGQAWPPHRLSDYYGADDAGWSDPDQPVLPTIKVLVAVNDTNGVTLASYLNTLNDALAPTSPYNADSTFTGEQYTGDFPSNLYTTAYSDYDVMIWSNNYQGQSNTWATMSSFLSNGKAVIIQVFGHTSWQASTVYSNIGSQYQISQISSYNYHNGFYYPAGSHDILTGVTEFRDMGYENTYMALQSSIANSTSSGQILSTSSWHIANWCVYSGGQRRVDINQWPGGSWLYQTTNYQNMRLLLNACYWSADKF